MCPARIINPGHGHAVNPSHDLHHVRDGALARRSSVESTIHDLTSAPLQQFPPAMCCFKRQQSESSYSSSDSEHQSCPLSAKDDTIDTTEREPISDPPLEVEEPTAESPQLEGPKPEKLDAIEPAETAAAETADGIFKDVYGYVWPTNPGFDDSTRNSVLRSSADRGTDARKTPRYSIEARRGSRRFKQRDLSDSSSDGPNARYGQRFAPDRNRRAADENRQSASSKYAKHKRRKYKYRYSDDDDEPDDHVGHHGATPCPCTCHHRHKSRRDKDTARHDRHGSVDPPSNINSPTPSEQRCLDLNEHWSQRKAYTDRVNEGKRQRPAAGWELTKNVLIIVFAVTVIWHAFMLRFFFISRTLSVMHTFLVLTGAAHADYQRYADYLRQME